MANKIKYWTGVVTQLTNDSFESISLNTGIRLDVDEALAIKRIELEFNSLQVMNWAAGDRGIEGSVSTAQNSLAFLDNKDVIFKSQMTLRIVAGQPVVVPQCLAIWDPIADFITVSQFLHIAMTTYGTGQTNDLFYRIYYSKVGISATEKTQLLAG